MLPDAETVTVAYLRARPELAGVTIRTVPPRAELPTGGRYVLIERIGGVAEAPSWRSGALIDRPGVTVQVWAGPDRADARSLLRLVLDALAAARGAAVPGGVIARVVELAGPTPLPDPAAPKTVHRFTATVQLTVHSRSPVLGS